MINTLENILLYSITSSKTIVFITNQKKWYCFKIIFSSSVGWVNFVEGEVWIEGLSPAVAWRPLLHSRQCRLVEPQLGPETSLHTHIALCSHLPIGSNVLERCIDLLAPGSVKSLFGPVASSHAQPLKCCVEYWSRWTRFKLRIPKLELRNKNWTPT